MGLINKFPELGLLFEVCHSYVIPLTATGCTVVKSKIALLQLVTATLDKLGMAGVGFKVTRLK